MVQNVSMIIVQDQIRSLFIFFVYNLDLLSLLHCFSFSVCFFLLRFVSFIIIFFFFFIFFFYFISTKTLFGMKYSDFLTLCARHRIGVVLVGVIASIVVDVIVGVVVGIVASLCHWCSCGIALCLLVFL